MSNKTDRLVIAVIVIVRREGKAVRPWMQLQSERCVSLMRGVNQGVRAAFGIH